MKYIVGLLFIAVLGLGGYVLLHPSTVTETQIAGAVPSLQNPLCIAGVCTYYQVQPMRLATSTACDLLSPNATTTIETVWANITGAPIYAQAYSLGYSSQRNATTSALYSPISLGASIGGVFATTGPNTVLPPNTHVVFNLSTSTSAGLSQTAGYCGVILDTVANVNSI